jgi:hypothetical protein
MVATGSALSIAGKLSEKEKASLAGDIQAFSELSNSILEVSRHLTTLFSILIAEILIKHIPNPEIRTENFPNGPKLSEFTLPYFFDEDEDDWTRNFSAKLRANMARIE